MIHLFEILRPFSIITLLWMFFFSCSEKTVESIPKGIESVKVLESEDDHLEEPFLFTSNTGQTYLSWIEKSADRNLFKYAALIENNWSDPILIAEGSNWFVNWADYPQMASFEDGTLVAFFLEKSGPGTFAYDIKVTLSSNGIDWSDPIVLHDDKTQTEHGFVSMAAWGENMLISWLDGRNTGNSTDDEHHHGHQGQMTLRASLLDSKGNKLDEWELDERVCDCCQTSVSMSANGPVIVFRDRSETEIRDLGIIRWLGDKWSETNPVYMDLWQIAACPVNGPRVAAWENQVVVAWYTAAKDSPEVKVAISTDSGESFVQTTRVDLGKTIGRVDIDWINEDLSMITWMEEGKIMARTITIDGKLGQPILIAETSEKRSSGFPQMSVNGDQVWFAWTDDSAERKKIRISKLTL
ncbi:exo-alpha-sialidase [Aquiflexum lacus]|uniref:exo-alpha-sialidase n=1 Tax=Aquiflexum lacus TaxID=2483805 RepID=UPI001894DE59|nr:exo-alpha-sialidase [Aquiflexum lacus]